MDVHVRPIVSRDAAAYRTILQHTSDEDRYFRFFRAIDRDAAGDFSAIVPDRPDLTGFIAFVDGRPAGVAHAARSDLGAELAIVVAEGFRRAGLGERLLTALITYLQLHGCERFIAHSLGDNVAFARLATKLGMRVDRVDGADHSWSLVPVFA